MTEACLAAAVKAAVDHWVQTTAPEQLARELGNSATLSAELGLVVQATLETAGHSPNTLRSELLSSPYYHLSAVFNPEPLLDTPQGFYPVPDTTGTLAGRAAALAVHGLLHLETVSYACENEGHLFVNLVPIPGAGAFAEKSIGGLRGHTDAVSFPFNGEDEPQDLRIAPSPDIITLVGLRNPAKIPTTVMPLTDVLAKLTPADVNELRTAQYSFTSQKTFVEGMKRILGSELVIADVPIVHDNPRGTYVRYSHSCVVASETEGAAERAALNFEAVCDCAVVPVVVQPGDVLIVNNRTSLHGRGVVGEGTGGRSRWLLRTYALDTSTLPPQKRHGGGLPVHVLYP